MNSKLASLLAAAGLAACGTSAAPRQQTQQSTAGQTFSFQSSVDPTGRKADDPAAETTRIKELERNLQANRMCSKGYEITLRRAIVQIGEQDLVYYQGRCNS